MREERPRPDIQAFTAEHVGVVDQVKCRRVEAVAAGIGGLGERPLGNRCCQQTGLFQCQRSLYGADVLLHQVAGRPWQVLDHCPSNHLRTGCQLALQADQLFFEQGQGLGHTHQHPVERALPVFAGRYERHTVERQAIAHQVLFQGQVPQVRVTAADHLQLARKACSQGTEAVIEHQYPAIGVGCLIV